MGGMSVAEFVFGPWRPDMRRTNTKTAQNARGAIHVVDGYQQLESLVPEGDALPDRALAALSVFSHVLTSETYAGTDVGLYRFNGTGWDDYSKAGGYLLPAEEVWEPAVWKDGQLIMSNRSEPMQTLEVGVETQFSDLFQGTTYAPQAKTVAIVGEFLMMGNIDEPTLGTHPDRVWWTAINNITDPDPDLDTQANFRDIPGDIGEIQRIFGWDYGLIFAETAMYRANYVGGSEVWDIQIVEPERGLYVQTAAAASGRRVFYLAADGFYVTDGLTSVPIGEDKINDYFLTRLASRAPYSISARADPQRRVIMFALSTSGDRPNEIAIFSEDTNEWTWINEDIDVLFQDRGRAVNLDVPPWDDYNLDIPPYSELNLDSSAFAGGVRYAAAINADHRLVSFSGEAYPVEIETGDLQPYMGQRTYCQGLRPIVETSGNETMTVQVGRKDTPSDTVSWSPDYSRNGDGKFTFEEEARYLRFRLKVSGGFDTIYALQTEDGDLKPAGGV